MAYDQNGNFIPNPMNGQFGQPFAGQALPVQNTTPVVMPQQQGYQGMRMGGMPAPDYGTSALASALRGNSDQSKDKNKNLNMGQRMDNTLSAMYSLGDKAGAMYDKIGSFFS